MHLAQLPVSRGGQGLSLGALEIREGVDLLRYFVLSCWLGLGTSLCRHCALGQSLYLRLRGCFGSD